MQVLKTDFCLVSLERWQRICWYIYLAEAETHRRGFTICTKAISWLLFSGRAQMGTAQSCQRQSKKWTERSEEERESGK